MKHYNNSKILLIKIFKESPKCVLNIGLAEQTGLSPGIVNVFVLVQTLFSDFTVPDYPSRSKRCYRLRKFDINIQ